MDRTFLRLVAGTFLIILQACVASQIQRPEVMDVHSGCKFLHIDAIDAYGSNNGFQSPSDLFFYFSNHSTTDTIWLDIKNMALLDLRKMPVYSGCKSIELPPLEFRLCRILWTQGPNPSHHLSPGASFQIPVRWNNQVDTVHCQLRR